MQHEWISPRWPFIYIPGHETRASVVSGPEINQRTEMAARRRKGPSPPSRHVLKTPCTGRASPARDHSGQIEQAVPLPEGRRRT